MIGLKVVFYLFLAVLMIVFWPFLMLLKRWWSTRNSAIATAQDKFNMKGEVNEDLVVSARAQIIEVSIESSFQPLLQLYLLLPLLLRFESYEANDFFSLFSPQEIIYNRKTECVQFWAILTSMISLSWSFTFYQAMQKKGALNFGSNLAGRLMLLFSNLLQISSRLIALVLYAYTFGEGQFWQMIVSVMIHIVLMSVLHHWTSDEWGMETFQRKGFKRTFKIMYHCLINGICNLYIHNWIMQIKNDNSKMQRKQFKKKGTVFRQTLYDTIFVVENLIIIFMSYIKFRDDLPPGLLIFIAFSQYIGIALKLVYYSKFHIWSTSFDAYKSVEEVKVSSKKILSRIRKYRPCQKTISLEASELEADRMLESTKNERRS